jgi:hypothetical protein
MSARLKFLAGTRQMMMRCNGLQLWLSLPIYSRETMAASAGIVSSARAFLARTCGQEANNEARREWRAFHFLKLKTFRQNGRPLKSKLKVLSETHVWNGGWRMKIGYARVSTDGQTLHHQQMALRDAGCDQVFAEKVSGAKSDRQQLTGAIGALGQGDTLIVC